jgi:putative ABC transport system ATP-binding protein
LTATLASDQQLSLLGDSASGNETLAVALMRLTPLAAGTISVNGRNLMELPESFIGRRFGYAGPEAYLFPVSVRDNLLYGLKHAPLRPFNYDEAAARQRALTDRESKRAGNPLLDIRADWIDYEAAGAKDMAELDQRIVETLGLIELEDDVYQFGLRGTIDVKAQVELAERFVQARQALHSRLSDPSLAGLVEQFDIDRYNKNMSVAENLMFGAPVGPAFQPDRIATNPYLHKVLVENDLGNALADVGRRIAETMVELFADLPPGHPFFEQFSFIQAEDLPEYRALLGKLAKNPVASLPQADRDRFASLAFPYIEARHRLGLIDADLETRLLAARRSFAQNLPDDLKGSVEFYDSAKYIAAAAVQDNMLFGRLVYGQAQAASRIGKVMAEVVDKLGLRPAVLRVGLDYQAGIAGKRLTAAQRQKIGLGRALLKRPDYLIVNEALALLDAAAQNRITKAVLKIRTGKGVLWVMRHAQPPDEFDKMIVMKDGRVADQGKPAEVLARITGVPAEQAAQ